MVLNGAAARRIDDFIRNDVSDVGHYAEIGVERLEDIYAFLVSHPPELPDRDVHCLRGGCERFTSTASVGRGENTDDFMFAAF